MADDRWLPLDFILADGNLIMFMGIRAFIASQSAKRWHHSPE